MATRARTKAAKGTKIMNGVLKEIDNEATNASTKKLKEEQLNAISAIRNGGGYAKVELSKFDDISSTCCDYCGARSLYCR